VKNLRRPPNLDLEPILEWDAKILRLLGHHQISLRDPHYEFWVLMQSEDGGVHATLMQRVEPQLDK